jgi:hypothetical protein
MTFVYRVIVIMLLLLIEGHLEKIMKALVK